MFTTEEGKRVLKYSGFVLVMLGIFLVVNTVSALKSWSYIGKNVPATNVLSVMGEAEVFALPDIASFSFGVTADAKTTPEAQEKMTTKMNAALALLKKAGIEDKDIKTADYSVYPKYQYSNSMCTAYSCPPSTQTIIGYTVNQTVSVKVRDIEKAGTILGTLGGAEVTNLSGINFTVDDMDKAQAEARAKAIADAKAKAKVLSRDLGVKLVRIVNFSESGNYPMPYYGEGMMAMDVAANSKAPTTPQVPGGENKIVSNIVITYEIR